MTPKVKICGLKTDAALDAAIESGADFVGFVFYPPSPRSLSPAAAGKLAARSRGRARSVALVVDADDALIDRIVQDMQPDLFQFHGEETPERVAEVAQRFATPIIKAIAIREAGDAGAALAYKDSVEFVLFDAKAPPTLAGALPGGNGLSFDWHLLDTVRGRIRYMLSGGLTAENVAEAVRLTQPFAVDVSSGVETKPGEKSPDLIRRFIAAAKPARTAAPTHA